MEANDMKALREALVAINKNTDLLDIAEDIAPKLHPSHSFVAVQIRKIVRAALAKTPRQCDVGTPDEQSERFENFCLKHIGCAEETGGRHCVGCPLEKASKNITQKCELYWAQMPYEKGGAN